eukprot:gene34497-24601_t
MEGDVMRLTSRPHSAWTLDRVSRLLYGKAASAWGRCGLSVDDWCGTAQLDEMAGLEELAMCEYRATVDTGKRLAACSPHAGAEEGGGKAPAAEGGAPPGG